MAVRVVATFAEGMTCGHAMATMVGLDHRTWVPNEIYECDTEGCAVRFSVPDTPEACGFAAEVDGDWD